MATPGRLIITQLPIEKQKQWLFAYLFAILDSKTALVEILALPIIINLIFYTKCNLTFSNIFKYR